MEYLQGAKKGLIQLLRQKNITDENVLTAFDKVDRHLFVESFLWPRAYEDMALQIHCEQTISQPFTVAFQSQLLNVQKGDKILEIGTGSGFQSAILSNMGAKVFSIERQYELYKKTKILLEKIDHKIFLFYGDGFLGVPQYAPYDKMIVTCGAPQVPTSLLNQLKPGGIIVIPVGEGTQTMKKITKIDDSNFEEENFGDFKFVPMLKNTVNSKKNYF